MRPTVDSLDKRVASLEQTRWLDRIILRIIVAPIVCGLAVKWRWIWMGP